MLTDNEIDRLEGLIQAEVPEIIERAKRRHAALHEQTISGQLRRAVKSSGLRYDKLAEASGLSAEQIDAFMTGDNVPVGVADALASALHYSLMPEHATTAPV